MCIEKGKDEMKKRWIGKLFKGALTLLVIAVVFYGIKRLGEFWPYMNLEEVTKEQLDELPLEKCTKLMIVAHPDDETLWGGFGLIEDDYFVVCITNGNNKVRSAEFQKVMETTEDVGLILSYPDKIGRKKSDWKYWKDDIRKDLETILKYKQWDLVVTHNEDGEYGHPHHIMTHEMEVDAYKNTDCKAEQYFFGKYYKKKELPQDLEGKVTGEKLERKYQIYKIYESQSKTIGKLSHMTPYENWIQGH